MVGNMGGESLKGDQIIVARNATIARRSKEMKEDLKKMRMLKEGGRKETEEKREVAIGYSEDDDGALLVEVVKEREASGKKCIMDSGYSFHMFSEKEKFSKFEACDGDLVTLPNEEIKKVEGIGEVVVETHDGVKRKLQDVRYVPKVGRNLISLEILEEKGCTFKACDGALKVTRWSMVLMKGVRNESNLYVLQGGGDCQGEVGGGAMCGPPRRMTFVA